MEDLLERMQREAEAKVDQIIAAQREFEAANQRIADFVSATQRIRMYEPQAREDVDIAKLVEAERKKLAAMEAVTDAEVQGYRLKLAEFGDQLKAAKAERAKSATTLANYRSFE